jgi:hypothetical protein
VSDENADTRSTFVAEQLDPDRLAAGGREDVDHVAAGRHLAALVDGAADALVPRLDQRREQLVALDHVAAATRTGAVRESRPPIRSTSASTDTATTPPAASTSSARARSPTRCGGGASGEPHTAPRCGKVRDLRLRAVGGDRLGEVARRVVVLHDHRDRGALAVGAQLVQRRQHQRQHRLGDAHGRARRGAEPARQGLRGVVLEQRPERDVRPGGSGCGVGYGLRGPCEWAVVRP